MTTRIPTEQEEQIRVVDYLELLKLQGKVLIFTTHADNMKTSIYVAKQAKKLGKRAGYPDFTIVTNTGVLLYIELKRVKGGVTSKEQKEWINALNTCDGVKAWICRGYEECIHTINLFIK